MKGYYPKFFPPVLYGELNWNELSAGSLRMGSKFVIVSKFYNSS